MTVTGGWPEGGPRWGRAPGDGRRAQRRTPAGALDAATGRRGDRARGRSFSVWRLGTLFISFLQISLFFYFLGWGEEGRRNRPIGSEATGWTVGGGQGSVPGISAGPGRRSKEQGEQGRAHGTDGRERDLVELGKPRDGWAGNEGQSTGRGAWLGTDSSGRVGRGSKRIYKGLRKEGGAVQFPAVQMYRAQLAVCSLAEKHHPVPVPIVVSRRIGLCFMLCQLMALENLSRAVIMAKAAAARRARSSVCLPPASLPCRGCLLAPPYPCLNVPIWHMLSGPPSKTAGKPRRRQTIRGLLNFSRRAGRYRQYMV